VRDTVLSVFLVTWAQGNPALPTTLAQRPIPAEPPKVFEQVGHVRYLVSSHRSQPHLTHQHHPPLLRQYRKNGWRRYRSRCRCRFLKPFLTRNAAVKSEHPIRSPSSIDSVSERKKSSTGTRQTPSRQCLRRRRRGDTATSRPHIEDEEILPRCARLDWRVVIVATNMSNIGLRCPADMHRTIYSETDERTEGYNWNRAGARGSKDLRRRNHC
jgi:hypothetical protein